MDSVHDIITRNVQRQRGFFWMDGKRGILIISFLDCFQVASRKKMQLGQEQQFLTALGGVLSTDRIFSGIEWRLGALFDGAISLVKV